MTDFSFITELAKEIESVRDLKPIPAQRDVKIAILDVSRGPSKSNPNNPDMLTVTYELVDFPTAPSIKKYFPLPVPTDEQRKRDSKLRGLREFFKAHNFQFEEALRAIYNEDDDGNKVPDKQFFLGSTAWCVVDLTKETYVGQDGVERQSERNEITSYL